MKSLVTVWLVLPLVPLGLLAAQNAAPAEKPSADVVDLVFLARNRPVLLRLHVSVDGRSFRDLQNDYFDEWFRYLDVDGDGLLSAEELRRAVDGKGMALLMAASGNGMGIFDALRQPEPTVALLRSGNDKITPAEFRAYYSGQCRPLRILLQLQDPRPLEDAGLRLFKIVDADGDGKLSGAELQVLPKLLARLDVNDDEYLSPRELGETDLEAAVQRVAIEDREGYLGQVGSFFHIRADNKNLPGRLLSLYSRDGMQTLRRAESGLDEASFNRLDVNRDGRLDENELAHWHERAADLEFTLQLGKAPAVAFKAQGGIEVVKRSERICSFAVDDSVAVTLVNADRTVDENRFAARLLFDCFERVDVKKKGYVDVDDFAYGLQKYFHVRTDGARLFRMIDRDGDGKATLRELERFVALLYPEKDLSPALSFALQGKGLFPFLDADGDGRLSQAELLQAKTRLAMLDRTKRGFITPMDFPAQHLITVHRTRPGDALTRNEPGLIDQAAVKNAPEWFRRMDRNGDGHVSPAEFLGTRAEFKRIDANGDGLISAEEAIRYDALLRKKK